MRTQQANGYSVGLPTDSDRNFLIRKSLFVWKGCLGLFKNFAARSFFLTFMVSNKNWLFFILSEKYWIFACTTCRIRHSDTPMFLNMDLIGLQGSLTIMAKISPRNWGVLIRAIRVSYPSCRTFGIITGLIQLFSNPLQRLTPPNSEKIVLELSVMNAKHYSTPFQNFWRSKLHSGAAFLTNTSLLHNRQNQKQKKWMHEIDSLNGVNLPIASDINLTFYNG